MTKEYFVIRTLASFVCFVMAAITSVVPAAIAATPTPAPTPPEKYEVLIGEGLAGSGFVVRHGEAMWGVCTLHQFDGKTPGELDRLEGRAIELDRAKVIKQTDVQAIPVRKAVGELQFLAYEPGFELAEGDELLVLGPAGDVVAARLTAKGLRNALSIRGGSGDAGSAHREAVHGGRRQRRADPAEENGAVIGVMLSADDARQARVVGFETLCLGGGGAGGVGDKTASRPATTPAKRGATAPAASASDADANANAAKPATFQDALRPLLEKLPKGTGWTPEPVDIPRHQIGLAYFALPRGERDAAVKATRQMVGYAGQGGPDSRESISFLLTGFTDREVAKAMPAQLADGYKPMLPMLRRGGINIDDVKVTALKPPSADVATLVRARGSQDPGERPFHQHDRPGRPRRAHGRAGDPQHGGQRRRSDESPRGIARPGR